MLLCVTLPQSGEIYTADTLRNVVQSCSPHYNSWCDRDHLKQARSSRPLRDWVGLNPKVISSCQRRETQALIIQPSEPCIN